MKFWVRIFATAFAAAGLLAAAQLGVVYGLDAIELDRSFTESPDDWNISVTWVAWFTLVAIVGGASYAAGQAQALSQRIGFGARIVLAFGAGTGGLLAVLALTTYRMTNAKLLQPLHPALTLTITVCGAVAAGMLLAALIAANPPLTTNVAVVSVGMWVVGTISVVNTAGVMNHLYSAQARLGVLDIVTLQSEPRARFSLPALAFAAGVLVALTGWWRNRSRVLIAISGTAGPLLVAIAYLLAGPGASREVTFQADAYLGAMIAVVAGLLPSVAIALLPQRRSG